MQNLVRSTKTIWHTCAAINLKASVSLVACVAFLAGCAPLYTYEEPDDEPIDQICSGAERVETRLLIEDDCGVELARLSSEAACEEGNALGCMFASSLILSPTSLTESIEVESMNIEPRARRFAVRGCDLGNERACHLLVMMNYQSNALAKREEAFETMEAKCSIGMGSMCYFLGNLYEGNASRAYEYEDALEYYEQGCQHDDEDACYEAGKMHEAGLGTEESDEAAKEAFEAACDLRQEEACDEIDREVPPVEDQEVAEWNRFASEAFTEMLEEGCSNGFRHACTLGGRLIERGELHSRYVDDERALSLFEEGCERGSAESCFYQARMVHDGRGTDPHTRNAHAIAEDSCKRGYERGCRLQRDTAYRLLNEERTDEHAARCRDDESGKDCYLAGKALTYDGLVEVDVERARQLLLGGCDLEYADACVAAAELFETDRAGDEAEIQRARSLYQTACDLDASQACHRLGLHYRRGVGVDRDIDRAVDYLEDGCDLGASKACGDLGDVLAHGDSARRDEARAEKLLLQGCGGGDLKACSNLGFLLIERDTDESTDEGLALLNFACTNDEADACNGLGEFHSKTDDEERLEKAADHLEKGCLIDSASACANLGEMYAEGRGVERDVDRSRRLYEEACAADHEGACRRLERASDSSD